MRRLKERRGRGAGGGLSSDQGGDTAHKSNERLLRVTAEMSLELSAPHLLHGQVQSSVERRANTQNVACCHVAEGRIGSWLLCVA